MSFLPILRKSTDEVTLKMNEGLYVRSQLLTRHGRLINEYNMRPSDYDLNCAVEAKNLIESDIRYHYTISDLAHRLNIGEKRLKIAFKCNFDKGIFEYLQTLKVDKATELLTNGASSKEIAILLGYRNAGSFSRAFKKTTGMISQKWKETFC